MREKNKKIIRCIGETLNILYGFFSIFCIILLLIFTGLFSSGTGMEEGAIILIGILLGFRIFKLVLLSKGKEMHGGYWLLALPLEVLILYIGISKSSII